MRRFDTYLPNVNAKELKYMARTWGGDELTRKNQFIMCIRKGLADPARVHQVIAALDPFEYNILALLKRFGGTATPSELMLVVRISGIKSTQSYNRYSSYSDDLWSALIKKGLLLVDSISNPTSSYELRYGKLFSDDRLLAAVGEPQSEPLFTLQETANSNKCWISPQRSIFRSAPIVMLDLVGFMQSFEDQNGVRLTQSGSIRVNDLRKLTRARGWKKEEIVVDGFLFPTPAIALIQSLRQTGWIISKGNVLHLKEPAHTFAKLPISEQIQAFLQGIIKNKHWAEWKPPQKTYIDSDNYPLGRHALLTVLKDLPLTPRVSDFFSFDEFDQAFFNRIGQHFSLRSRPHRPSSRFNKLGDMASMLDTWRETLRQQWIAREKVWIRHAFSTWLYFFGLVELGLSKEGSIIGLRLTDLGQSLLNPEQNPSTDSSPVVNKSTWVIQPNFEIMVYLNHATTDQLAFLETHANRLSTEPFTAQYKLSRESVYKGLERGSTVEGIVQTLRTGSNRPLPQNIVVEIQEWASLREKIVLRRQVNLVEYPSTDARDQALEQNVLTGKPVGERFVLVATAARLSHLNPASSIDYAHSLPRCLSIKESGILNLSKGTTDLFIHEQLNTWAEPIKRNQWQLKQSRVAAAIKNGYTRAMLLDFINQRRTNSLPDLLELALQNWTGKKTPVTLQPVTLLHCKEAIMRAITKSKKLRGYIEGFVADDVVVIKQEQVDAFREELAWLGVQIGERLQFEQLD